MEDPLPMARIVLEKNKGDMKASLEFIRRQRDAARNSVLHKFWEDVEIVLRQATATPRPKKKKAKKAL